MKKTILTSLIVLSSLVLSYSVKAAPIAFEASYINYAWGYVNKGCLVDENRYVYKYEINSDEPMKAIRRVDHREFNLAKSLLETASKGTFVDSQGSRDAGTSTWSGNFRGIQVILKQEGDVTRLNSSECVTDLIKLMDVWCK